MTKAARTRIAVCLFTAPVLIIFSVVVTYPIIQTFLKSFTRWDGIKAAVFIGLRNYDRLFHSSEFYLCLKNGIYFTLVLVVYQIGLGSILTFAIIDKKLRFKNFFKSSYFIPVVLSVTMVGQLWLSIYNYDYGMLNSLFKALGFGFRQEWLVNAKSSIFAVAFTNAWQYMGIPFIFLYARALTIPEELQEAARIEGASNLKINTRILLPLMSETYKFCLILAITGGLNAFANMRIMTNGGPGTSTYTLTYAMYKFSMLRTDFGYATAISAILIIECLLATILINRFVARERYMF